MQELVTTYVPLASALPLAGGQEYFVIVSSLSVDYTNGTTFGAVFVSNADLTYMKDLD